MNHTESTNLLKKFLIKINACAGSWYCRRRTEKNKSFISKKDDGIPGRVFSSYGDQSWLTQNGLPREQNG